MVDTLKRQGLDVRLVVTGPPDPHVADIRDYFDELRALRRGMALDEETIFVHDGTDRYPAPLVIEGSVVAELYRIADLVLMPSLREGFGMPVFEAALVDRPVFATSIPAAQELPNFRYLIDADETPGSVAEGIRQWADSDAAHALRKVVRRDFTWSGIFAKKILPLIEEISGGGAGAPR